MQREWLDPNESRSIEAASREALHICGFLADRSL
jgi:hypothetical protein